MKRENTTGLVIASACLAFGAIALQFGNPNFFSAISVVLCWVYILFLLFSLAWREGHHANPPNVDWIPGRVSALVILIVLTIGVALAFAAWHLLPGAVHGLNIPDVSTAEVWDGLYFSAVAMTTTGFGDMYPITVSARMIVVWQMATGVLLLIGGFPLVVSRIGTWSEKQATDSGVPAAAPLADPAKDKAS